MIKKERAIKQSINLLASAFLVLALITPGVGKALQINRANVIDLTNQARSEQGLDPLTENSKLNKAAQGKARDMIEKDYWAHFHSGEKPWDWMNKYNYDYLQAGENLAIDFTDAAAMHQAWMESDSHRANLLNSKYTEIGVGIATGWFKDHETTIVVQMFGNPRGKTNISEKPQDDSNEVISGVETTEVSPQEENLTLAQSFKGFFSRIGSGMLNLWGGMKTGTNSLVVWINDNIFSDVSVYAD